MRDKMKYQQKFIEYLQYERNYSDHTIISYQKELEKFFEYLKSNHIPYEQITKKEIRTYLKHLDSLNYTNTTIAHHVSTIRTFYSYLVRKGYLKTNIWTQIENPKITRQIPNFLTTMELEQLFTPKDFTNSFEIRNRFILELLFATGLRVSELINIKEKDIDLSENCIRTLGKGRKERIVFFGDYAKDMLILYQTKSRSELLGNIKSEYLMVGKKRPKLTRQRISEILNEEVKKIGLQHHISPHVLRHTFATQLLNGGADIRSVQELLGHESLSTTQIYTHITNDQLRKSYLDNMPRK